METSLRFVSRRDLFTEVVHEETSRLTTRLEEVQVEEVAARGRSIEECLESQRSWTQRLRDTAKVGVDEVISVEVPHGSEGISIDWAES